MAEERTESQRGNGESAPKYSVDELLDNARTLTGYSRHLLAGALHGHTGKLTADGAARKAAAFVKQEVGS